MATDEYTKAVAEVGTHDRIIIDDGDGNEYVIRYPRSVVRRMESNGVNMEAAAEHLSRATLSDAEWYVKNFVLPGLKVEQPKMTFDDAEALWESVPDKETVILYLSVLFTQGVRAITTNPTETTTSFRLV